MTTAVADDAALAAALADPRWFAVDLDVRRHEVHLLQLESDVLERSIFIDTRIDATLADATVVALDRVILTAIPSAPPAFLFHTSFCCSTLLARALHVPPASIALKEPLLMRRLGDARVQGIDVAPFLETCVRLLSRPWTAGGRVAIKSTHAALNVALDCMALPAARGVLLYGTLEDFLVSNCKKPTETQQKVPQLTERALAASDYASRLSTAARAPRTFLQCVALQWCAQLALAHELFARVDRQQLRSLREQALLDDIEACSVRAAAHLQLPADPAALRTRITAAAGEHAKAPGLKYSPQRRAEEAQLVRSLVGRELDDAIRYAEQQLFPALSSLELPNPL